MAKFGLHFENMTLVLSTFTTIEIWSKMLLKLSLKLFWLHSELGALSLITPHRLGYIMMCKLI